MHSYFCMQQYNSFSVFHNMIKIYFTYYLLMDIWFVLTSIIFSLLLVWITFFENEVGYLSVSFSPLFSKCKYRRLDVDVKWPLGYFLPFLPWDFEFGAGINFPAFYMFLYRQTKLMWVISASRILLHIAEVKEVRNGWDREIYRTLMALV